MNTDKSSKEEISEERTITTESNKRLTAGRAKKILKREIKEFETPWHSVGDPILIKMGNRWRAMKYAGENIWNLYYIEEIDR